MKFFSSHKRDYPDVETSSLPDTWSVIEAEYGQHRLVGNLRDGIEPFMGHPAYPHQAGVALILNRPREDGLPEAKEFEQIYALEDAIQAKLEADIQSLLVAKWFVRGCRELVFYTRDVKGLSRRLDEIAARGTLNQIQLNTQKDPQWKVLRSVVSNRAAA